MNENDLLNTEKYNCQQTRIFTDATKADSAQPTFSYHSFSLGARHLLRTNLRATSGYSLDQ